MNHLRWLPLAALLLMPVHAQGQDAIAGTIDQAQIEAFNRYLQERDLGNLESGVWVFSLPPTRSREKDELGSIAYGLESYRLYAERNGKSAGQLGEVLGLNSFAYKSVKIPKDDLIVYFSANSQNRIQILHNYLPLELHSPAVGRELPTG